MQHFILTRFNLRLHYRHDKNGRAVQTEKWLRERFRLFETYCMPSVMAQTCRNFRWICLFDESTPEEFCRRVAGYRGMHGVFFPFYPDTEQARHFQEFFSRKVYELADKGDEDLLTTYLDNDDCLRDDFVGRVQEYAGKTGHGTIFTFRYGLQYYTEHDIAVRIPYENNHFLTYYERLSDTPRTVWGFWHFSIFSYRSVDIITVNNPRDPMWIEVVHNGNIDNDVKMTLSHKLITDRDYLRRYGLDRELRSGMSSVSVFATRFAVRFIRQVVRRAGNKFKKRWRQNGNSSSCCR